MSMKVGAMVQISVKYSSISWSQDNINSTIRSNYNKIDHLTRNSKNNPMQIPNPELKTTIQSNPNDTYSESIANELAYQTNCKKLKHLSIIITLTDILLIIALFLSGDAWYYALFILTEILVTIGIAFFGIKTKKVSEKLCQVQRYVVFAYTLVESVFLLALCVFGLATTSKSTTIVGLIFELMVPSLLVVCIKLYVVFVRKYVEKRSIQQEMRVEHVDNFYTYKEIDQTKGSVN